jgi:hypothetical protein
MVFESIFVVRLITVVVVPAAVVWVDAPATVSLVSTCALRATDDTIDNKNAKIGLLINKKG